MINPPISSGISTFKLGFDKIIKPFEQAFEYVGNQFENVAQEVYDKFYPPVAAKEATAQKNISFVNTKEAEPTITPDKKVMIIGDSQTVGIYGTKMDELVRGTKAKVVTFASCGSSPEWWFNGHSTTCGYWTKDISGKENRKNENPTPLINDLLKKEKPDIVIITMGGNMMKGATQANVTEQVDKIGKAVTDSGAKLFWVGPPKYDPSKRSPEQLETFYSYLRNSVPEHGTLVDSRPYIDKYSGPDGYHYWGKEGKKQAEKWATGAFNEIQNHKD